MPDRDTTFLADILEAARPAQTFIEGVDKKAFEQDLMRQAAVTRQIEIIGAFSNALCKKFGFFCEFGGIYEALPGSGIQELPAFGIDIFQIALGLRFWQGLFPSLFVP